LVQLAIGAKRKINDMVQACPMEMNELRTKVDLNIIPLGSYYCIIDMDWLDQNHVVLDYYNKEFTCLYEEGNLRTFQGIPRIVTIREVIGKDVKYLHHTWRRHLRIKCQVLKTMQY
jgi:hypothetical protein